MKEWNLQDPPRAFFETAAVVIRWLRKLGQRLKVPCDNVVSELTKAVLISIQAPISCCAALCILWAHAELNLDSS